jgi:1-hydroxycarotenoid 3,4-desaturase
MSLLWEADLAKTPRIAIIGSGIGGLVTGLQLAARGLDVTLVESAPTPGGKMREVAVAGFKIDAGPTVFTMRWAFEQILAEVGISLADRLSLRPLATLARHAWADGGQLDLFADAERSAEAIGDFAGKAEAEGYRQFCRRARAIYRTLREPFIVASRPNPISLIRRIGLSGLGDLMGISPFETLWGALDQHFRDPRLRQLFGRYATYCGASPFQAPATLMLIAHVEQDGVWTIEGGMHRLATTLADLARERGATFRFGQHATRILVQRGRVSGLELASGERLAADCVIMNGDAAALGEGLLGADASEAIAAPPRAARSLSAITWAMATSVDGFPLGRHNVFFSDEYRAEFDAIFRCRRLPRAPTVYVCAQDRDEAGASGSGSSHPERLLCLVNAPATGDHGEFDAAELQTCEVATFGLLSRCGLNIDRSLQRTVRTTPTDFARLFPATGGALYGRASHGWMASFARPGSRTRLPGLYLAGGSVHPGPGIPMAALSGRQAALSVMADLALRPRSTLAVTPGGMSMR